MPRNLKRYYGRGDLHFITFSCHQRRPLLAQPRASRSVPANAGAHASAVSVHRRRIRHYARTCAPAGERTAAANTRGRAQGTQAGHGAAGAGPRKPGGTAQAELFASPAARHFWQARYYDFNVWSKKKTVEKLRYMHRNPVKRGLVDSPEQWRWSSFRHYLYGESGAVVVDEVFAPRWAKSIKPGTPLPTQAALVWGTPS